MDEPTPVPPAGAQQARLRTDVFVTFGGKAATLLLGLATAAIVARELGPSGQAVFAVAFTLTLVLVQVGGLGFTTANPYFVAREPALLPRIVGNAVWFSALLGLVLIAAGVVLKLVCAVRDRRARLGAAARDAGRHSGRARSRLAPVDPPRPGTHGRLQRDRGRAEPPSR